MLDVGRRILGFSGALNRREWLRSKASRSAEEIVKAYERQLALFRAEAPHEQLRWLGSGGVLERHFARYIDSLVTLRGGERAEHLVALYETLWDAAKTAGPADGSEVLDSFGVLREQFEPYIEALHALGRREDVLRAVKFYAPHWQHNLGWGTLGGAAFKAGAPETAEPFFLKLKAGMEEWFRCEEMPMLARIWHTRGEKDQAKQLLVDAFQGTLAASRKASGSDRKLYEDAFQRLRHTLLELFPNDRATLARESIPETTLPPK